MTGTEKIGIDEGLGLGLGLALRLGLRIGKGPVLVPGPVHGLRGLCNIRKGILTILLFVY